MLQEKYRVPHFDAKAEANAYFAGLPVTFLVTSFYWDNLYMFGLAPQEGRRRQARLDVPDGQRAAGRHRRRGHRQGRLRHLQGRAAVHRQDRRHRRRGPDARADGQDALEGPRRRPVKYNAVEADVYRGFGFPGADEMGNMFQVYRDFEKEVLGARSLDDTRSLNPALQTFDQWLAKNKSKIPQA